MTQKSAFPNVKNVKLLPGFWQRLQKLNRDITLPTEYEQCKNTGRLDAWKLEWKPGMPNPPHIFWDSDVAKWIEAVGYSLALYPDPKLEAKTDEVISWMAAAQQPDGYLNTHFISVEPDKRWTNLRDWHELYCAGHLIEAAVAYYKGTGKRTLLDVMCRYADYIGKVFGPGKNQKHGYPGHEEIELALVKLADVTGKDAYLKLASYFIDERGKQPYYFSQEAVKRGEKEHVPAWMNSPANILPYAIFQAHLPVREQKTAEGHAVRACYLYAGMAGVAKHTGDQTLIDACKTLWENVTTRRMYITGGIGSSRFGERFSFDYDLPNEEAYAETCASIALVFFAHNMLELDVDSRYADVMERALYNGIISGLSKDGKRFFYDNILASTPPYYKFSQQKSPERQAWFGCACCPPNIARLLASISSYLFSSNDDCLWAHLYTSCNGEFTLKGSTVKVTERTSYPWDGAISFAFKLDSPVRFSFAVRIPGWCTNATLSVNGKPVSLAKRIRKGYAVITRTWATGDKLELNLPIQPQRVYAHPAVRQDDGKVALQAGPVVYCLEEADNGPQLGAIRLPQDSKLALVKGPAALGGIPVIQAKALRQCRKEWDADKLLYSNEKPRFDSITLKAVPYFLWANRKPGEMEVWIWE